MELLASTSSLFCLALSWWLWPAIIPGLVDFLWRRATRIYPTYWLISLPLLALAIVAPTFVNSSIQTPISLGRSFFLIPDTTPPLLAVGWTLVHELYFYLVFSIFLALRIPIWAGVIGWGVILLLIVAIFPDQLAVMPLLRVAITYAASPIKKNALNVSGTQ